MEGQTHITVPGNHNIVVQGISGSHVTLNFTTAGAAKTFEECFRVIPIGEVQPKDIMNNRRYEVEQGFLDFFYIDYRDCDAKLLSSVGDWKHAMVTGYPLAGKTRAILQLIRKMQEPDQVTGDAKKVFGELQKSVLLIPKQGIAFKDEVEIPQFDCPVVAFFDDLQFFLNDEQRIRPTYAIFDQLFRREKTVVLVTCRAGRELTDLESDRTLLEYRFWEKFERVAIPYESAESRVIVAKRAELAFNRWLLVADPSSAEEQKSWEVVEKMTQRSFNGTYGSLFLPIDDMKLRYGAIKKSDQPLHQSILYAAKCLYQLGAHSNGWFFLNLILHYCRQRLSDQAIPPYRFERALQELADDYFLIFNEGALRVEEVYLEEVIEPNASKAKILSDLIAYPPFEETGKGSESRLLNTFIRQEEKASFEDIRREYQPVLKKYSNPFTSALLLRKAGKQSFQEMERVFQLMEKDPLFPLNNVAFNTLIEHTPDYRTAMRYYQQLTECAPGSKDPSLLPDKFTFTTLLRRTSDPKEISRLGEEMKRLNIESDVISYTTLINKSPDFATAKGFLEEMKKLGLTPNEVLYTTLINKSPDFATAKGFLEEMKKLGLKPDEFSYNTLINKSPDFATAKGFLEEMKKLGLKPDEFSYTTLINKSPDFATANGFLEEMKKLGLTPNEVSYTTLINKSPDFATAKGFLEEMKKLGLTPNEVSYTTLIKKSDSEQHLKETFDEMVTRKLRPNSHTIQAILRKVSSEHTVQEYLSLMLSQKAKIADKDIPHLRAVLNRWSKPAQKTVLKNWWLQQQDPPDGWQALFEQYLR
ncbi:MAG: hypothetical protein JNJ90_18860 [Saprospiraceae bacterium]|nr:hypothetical protein [Saprospiraceae bacterium]